MSEFSRERALCSPKFQRFLLWPVPVPETGSFTEVTKPVQFCSLAVSTLSLCEGAAYRSCFSCMVEQDRLNLMWSEHLFLKDIGCRTIQPELISYGKGKVNVCKLAAWELPSLVNSGLSFTSVQTVGTHWLVDAVRLFGMYHAVLEWTGWNQCTDQLNSSFLHTAVLTYGPCEIRFGPFSSAMQLLPKCLVYQHLNGFCCNFCDLLHSTVFCCWFCWVFCLWCVCMHACVCVCVCVRVGVSTVEQTAAV